MNNPMVVRHQHGHHRRHGDRTERQGLQGHYLHAVTARVDTVDDAGQQQPAEQPRKPRCAHQPAGPRRAEQRFGQRVVMGQETDLDHEAEGKAQRHAQQCGTAQHRPARGFRRLPGAIRIIVLLR